MKIYLFYCSTSISSEDIHSNFSADIGEEIKTISLPCSGKVDVLYLVKAFETGADGVVVVTCRRGECRYLEGNLRARKRAEAVDSLLEEIGIGRGRIEVVEIGDGGTEQLIDDVRNFITRIRAIGNNTETPGRIIEVMESGSFQEKHS